MTEHSETVTALKRAGRRALYHLMKAGVEGLKAFEAIVDELGEVGRKEPPEEELRGRIELQ